MDQINDSHAYQYQEATWRDTRAVSHLEKVCFPQDAWPIWDVVAVLSFPDIVRLKTVTPADEMVGFIVGDRKRRQKIGWIATLGVLPEHRGRGIAAELLRLCENQLDLPVVRLSVRTSNEAAIKLYRKYGYQSWGVWRRYYKGGEDALVMQKRLDPSWAGIVDFRR